MPPQHQTISGPYCDYLRHADNGYTEIRYHGKWKYQHDVIMESRIGRELRPEESVHHVNCVKSDNRPSNLRLVTISEHCRIHATGYVYQDRDKRECFYVPSKAFWRYHVNILGHFYPVTTTGGKYIFNKEANAELEYGRACSAG